MTIGPHPAAITVNGEARRVPPGTTVHALLATLDVDPDAARGIAVAVNDEVVRKADWKARVLADEDAVEVVTAQQGG